jgi:hypothetical protein
MSRNSAVYALERVLWCIPRRAAPYSFVSCASRFIPRRPGTGVGVAEYTLADVRLPAGEPATLRVVVNRSPSAPRAR